jgi:tRNA modification GTPase
MFSTDDTIVAIATPPGRAGIGVIRLSGPDTSEIARRLLARRSPFEPRRATLTRVRDLTMSPASAADAADTRAGRAESSGDRGDHEGPEDGDAHEDRADRADRSAIDQVIVTSFPRPASYTGEDVIEISAHGSTLLLQRIVASALRAGARLAQPGEFTLRAFLNGRLDLVQAEAVGDLIDAVTPAQARQAFDQLEGTVTRSMSRIGERIFDLIVRLEASLDFPDEGYHFIVPAEASEAIDDTIAEIDTLLRAARGGRVIREGRQIAIAGAPNVGKSSLFNALVGTDRAIVTEVAGTTRDLLTERVDIEGVPVTFVDTAGLRETEEIIEREGVSRARGAAQVADLVLVMLDRSRALADEDRAFVRASLARDSDAGGGGAASRGGRIIVINKSDLPAAWKKDALGALESPIIEVSVKTGDGLDALRHAIFTTLVGEERLRDEAGLSNVRHIDLLGRSREALERARANAEVSTPEEIVISDLREAMDALDEITGKRSSEDVLQAIFARFCIGK